MADIYKKLSEDDQTFVSQEVTTGLWTGDTGSLTSFYTSTSQLGKANASYFVDVYNADPAVSTSADVQFSISYGNIHGSGSPTLNQSDTSTESTKAVYLQLKNILLDPTDSQFTMQGTSVDDVYAIVVSRARYKGSVDPGLLLPI